MVNVTFAMSNYPKNTVNLSSEIVCKYLHVLNVLCWVVLRAKIITFCGDRCAVIFKIYFIEHLINDMPWRTGNLSVFLKTSVIQQLCSFFMEKSRNSVTWVLKLIFVKRLVQRISLNHYMRFKVIEHSKITFKEHEKEIFQPKISYERLNLLDWKVVRMRR